jgi:hypothetical protein
MNKTFKHGIPIVFVCAFCNLVIPRLGIPDQSVLIQEINLTFMLNLQSGEDISSHTNGNPSHIKHRTPFTHGRTSLC